MLVGNIGSNENLYFSKTCFPNFFMIQKQDIMNSLKHSVYGYDPLHNQDEISIFLVLSKKPWFWLKDKYMRNTKNQTCIFPKWKIFSKLKNLLWKQIYQECVCMVYLSNPPTILSFTFYLKHKNLIPRHKSWSWSLPLKSSHPLDLVQAWSKSSLDHTVQAPNLDILSFVELCTY